MTDATPAIAGARLVRESGGRLPVVERVGSTPALTWAAESAQRVAGLLGQDGVVVLRGFDITSAAEFEAFGRALVAGPAVPYREAATPRHHVGGDVYSATDLDRRLEIFFHGENAHVLRFPRTLLFWCREPALTGGATTLSDCAEFARRLPKALRDRWREVGVQYERRFGFGVGIPWEKAFGSPERADVEAYFRQNNISWEWDGPRLRVKYNRWALVPHPGSGDEIWFNNMTFYHPVTLQDAMRRLAGRIGYDRMPHAARWGDGSEVEPEVAEELVALYRQCAIGTRWERHDVMLIDNLRLAHGRESFEGERDVAVLMLEEMRAQDLAVPAGLWATPGPASSEPEANTAS